MLTLRRALSFFSVGALVSAGVMPSLGAENDANETLLKWEDIQAGKYTITSIVPERKGEPLGRIISADQGAVVNVTVDEESLELHLEGSDTTIRLPRNRREDAGDGKHPYTHLGRDQKLMRVAQHGSKQRMTFVVLYVGHFVLESAAD